MNDPGMDLDIAAELRECHSFFTTGKTKSVRFRLEQLFVLAKCVADFRGEIVEALGADLRKPELEVHVSETLTVLEEI
jgi:aldehyde dehydrogenase (NAD+)